jgi:predicted ester cyclase
MESGSKTAFIRDLIDRFFNGHNPGLASTFFAPDVKWHGGSVGDYRGVETYEGTMKGFFAGLPDVRAIEQDAIEGPDSVAMRFSVSGTHRGPLWGIAPTGRQVQWQAIMIYRFEGGLIAEQWAAEDWAAILRDLGVLTPPWAR